MRLSSNEKRSGFTIVELIVVIVAIGVLATLAIFGYNGIQQTARDKAILSDMESVEGEITRYAVKNGGIFGPELTWNSDDGSNANIAFTPSPGNTITIGVSNDGYCIRGYNPKSNSTSAATAVSKGSTCISEWTQIGASANMTCGIGGDSKAYCWGTNTSGQLGNGTTANTTIPVAVSTDGVLSGKTIKTLSMGYSDHVCAIASDNLAYCWGSGSAGKLGSGSSANSPIPVAVSRAGLLAGKTIKSMDSSVSTCVVASDNLAYCWGSGTSGQLGNGGASNTSSAVAVSTAGVLSGKTVKNVAVGNAHACAIASDNLAYCWGNNSVGQLGDGTTTSSSVPVAVSMTGALVGKTIKSITGGGDITCAIASDNLAYCWGSGSAGKLGNGATANSSIPVAVLTTGVLSGRTIKAISSAASGSHTCVIASNNLGYCWGNGTSGQLGNNTVTTSTSAVAVSTSGALSGKTITSISANSTETCAIASDKRAYCWGNNTTGRFGDGTTTSSPVPVQVAFP